MLIPRKKYISIDITRRKDYLMNIKEICHVNQFTFCPIIEKKFYYNFLLYKKLIKIYLL